MGEKSKWDFKPEALSQSFRYLHGVRIRFHYEDKILWEDLYPVVPRIFDKIFRRTFDGWIAFAVISVSFIMNKEMMVSIKLNHMVFLKERSLFSLEREKYANVN